MSSQSSGDVVNLFKRVYGDLQNLLPEDFILAKEITFSQKQKVGEAYLEAVALTNETGITLCGTTMQAFELNPAIAGTVQQATVTPYSSALASLVPWGVISRSAGGGDKAFFDATKWIVKNNLRSHGKFLEIFRLYGQATGLLGYTSYYSGTYRNASFVNGTGTINGITFTNGVNSASKAILFQPGTFAAGTFVAMEGVRIQQLSSSAIVGDGKLVTVEPDWGYITVDFTPVAASTATSTRICFQGEFDAREQIGVNNILSNTGTLFGISTSAYSLWRGNQVDCGQQKFSLPILQKGVAQAVARGGLDGDLFVLVNPRTWATLITTEAGLRMYDSTYKPSEAENGFESITFYHQTGKAVIKAHRMVKEGEAYAMHMADWSRSGSAEVSFTVPGIDKEIIFPTENMTSYSFRSYSDQYLFCHGPARSIYFYNINDEATS